MHVSSAALAPWRLDMGNIPRRLIEEYRYNSGSLDKETRVQLLQLLISGVAQGCIYGLIALGFVLIYKATETVSFAQGDLMMVGAFGGLAAMTMLGFPFWLSVPAAIVAMGVFGVLLVGRDEHAPPFAPQDLKLLQAISSRAGIALINARLYEEIEDANQQKNRFLSMPGRFSR